MKTFLQTLVVIGLCESLLHAILVTPATDLDEVHDILANATKLTISGKGIPWESDNFSERLKAFTEKHIGISAPPDIKSVASLVGSADFRYDADVSRRLSEGYTLGTAIQINVKVDDAKSFSILGSDLLICDGNKAYQAKGDSGGSNGSFADALGRIIQHIYENK